VFAVLAAVVIAVARPVIHAAEIALQIVLITAAVTARSALIAAATYVAWRIHRRHANAARAMPACRPGGRSAVPLSACRAARSRRRGPSWCT
jgi:nitrogen fixation protein FixH